jgi:hypothetical protein
MAEVADLGIGLAFFGVSLGEQRRQRFFRGGLGPGRGGLLRGREVVARLRRVRMGEDRIRNEGDRLDEQQGAENGTSHLVELEEIHRS